MEYVSNGKRAEAYCSNPKGGSSCGQVVVIHEVWGFTGFIRNLCGQLSRQGFQAVAPVLYWRDKELFSPARVREGMNAVWHLDLEERYQLKRLEAAMKKGHVSGETESMLRTLYDKRFRRTLLLDLFSLVRHLRKESSGTGMAALGFSMGGKFAMQLAAGFHDLAACVVYSAEPVRGATLRRVLAPMLLLYGGKDRFMLADVPAFVRESIARGKELELKIYRSAGHEFFDSTNQKYYHRAAAEDAWATSGDFLRRNLSAAPGRSDSELEKKSGMTERSSGV